MRKVSIVYLKEIDSLVSMNKKTYGVAHKESPHNQAVPTIALRLKPIDNMRRMNLNILRGIILSVYMISDFNIPSNV